MTPIDDVINAQADLQTALGIVRLHKPVDPYIEERLHRALATLHRVLLLAGRPMAGPSRHPEVEYPYPNHECAYFASNPRCMSCGLRKDRELPS